MSSNFKNQIKKKYPPSKKKQIKGMNSDFKNQTKPPPNKKHLNTGIITGDLKG